MVQLLKFMQRPRRLELQLIQLELQLLELRQLFHQFMQQLNLLAQQPEVHSNQFLHQLERTLLQLELKKPGLNLKFVIRLYF